MTDTLLKMTADTSASQNRGELDKLRVYLITDRTLLPQDQLLNGIEAALKVLQNFEFEERISWRDAFGSTNRRV